MDIEILLILQQFREAINDFLTPLMEGLSLFSISYLILIPAFLYWIINKKNGLYILASYYLSCGCNCILKLTICAYRPWIRDPRVIPAGDSITTATGYSFPSGHAAIAGAQYGGIAVSYKENKKIRIPMIILILLTGFSRLYLGVHTPQDVLVGLLISAVSLWVMLKVFGYLEEHPEKENWFLLGMFVFGWLALLYIKLKSYPMVYIDGNLLVDPDKMMNDGFGDIALMIAFPVARYIEKRWVGFEAMGWNKKGILAGISGLIPLMLMIPFIGTPLNAAFGAHWGKFIRTTILVFYIIVLYPCAIRYLWNHKKEEK